MKLTFLLTTILTGFPLFETSTSAAEIRTVEVKTPIPMVDNSGDTWVSAWAKNGAVYTPSNDTEGFKKVSWGNIEFNRLDGDDPKQLSGVTVNPMSDYGFANEEEADHCTWKSSGCYAVDGALYWVVARHMYGEKSGDPMRRQTAANASIILSTNYGRTWVRSARQNYDAPMFAGRRFATPYFVEYGQDGKANVHNGDKFLYAVSNNGFWDNGDNLILGRIRRDKIAALDAKDWEFYIGGDGMKDVAWTHDMTGASLVLDSPGKLGMNGMVYLPSLQRYLMIAWYYPAGGGKMKDACRETVWDFYQAPAPWGPWTKISSHRFSPQGFYSPQVCPKFNRDGDKSLFVLTAGDWNNPEVYRLTIVPIELQE